MTMLDGTIGSDHEFATGPFRAAEPAIRHPRTGKPEIDALWIWLVEAEHQQWTCERYFATEDEARASWLQFRARHLASRGES